MPSRDVYWDSDHEYQADQTMSDVGKYDPNKQQEAGGGRGIHTCKGHRGSCSVVRQYAVTHLSHTQVEAEQIYAHIITKT